jgi:hypothetical protein
VDSFYDKLHGKGLNVIEVNASEDGKNKVAKFVQKKGDGMSYPVAYKGRGPGFQETWLKPAGVNGTPHTFVVKNGRLLFMIHPASLTENMIQTLLAGGEAESALLKKLHRAKGCQKEIKALVGTYSSQLGVGDHIAAKETLSRIRDQDETYPALPGLEVGLAATQEKSAEVMIKLDQDWSSNLAMMLGTQLENGHECPSTRSDGGRDAQSGRDRANRSDWSGGQGIPLVASGQEGGSLSVRRKGSQGFHCPGRGRGGQGRLWRVRAQLQDRQANAVDGGICNPSAGHGGPFHETSE